MSAKDLLMVGKVKEVYSTDDPEQLVFRFTDKISVFDKIIPSEIPGKGESLNRCATHWFGELEQAGIPTHFISQPDATSMRVKRVEVDRNYASLTPERTNYLIPVEVICRHYIAGSLHDRLKKNPDLAKSLGVEDISIGTKLPEPLIEMTTKLEPTDELLTDAEALDMAGLTMEEYEKIKETILRVDQVISERMNARGLIHVDGKKEFGFDQDRNLMVIDTFGTADEDRFWEADAFAKGEIRQVSKEFVRQHYRSTGYHEQLYGARDRGESEPDIPPLPADIIARTSELYTSFQQRVISDSWP